METRSVGSVWSGRSIYSNCLSVREVDRVRRLVEKRDREKRKASVVIKGMTGEEEWFRTRMENFLNTSLGIEVKVTRCRRSGRVWVVKMESEQMKREVMTNKRKLKSGNVFIEIDLS